MTGVRTTEGLIKVPVEIEGLSRLTNTRHDNAENWEEELRVMKQKVENKEQGQQQMKDDVTSMLGFMRHMMARTNEERGDNTEVEANMEKMKRERRTIGDDGTLRLEKERQGARTNDEEENEEIGDVRDSESSTEEDDRNWRRVKEVHSDEIKGVQKTNKAESSKLTKNTTHGVEASDAEAMIRGLRREIKELKRTKDTSKE